MKRMLRRLRGPSARPPPRRSRRSSLTLRRPRRARGKRGPGPLRDDSRRRRLPVPGVPRGSSRGFRSSATVRSRSLPGPTRWSCPAKVSRVSGRMRSARAARGGFSWTRGAGRGHPQSPITTHDIWIREQRWLFIPEILIESGEGRLPGGNRRTYPKGSKKRKREATGPSIPLLKIPNIGIGMRWPRQRAQPGGEPASASVRAKIAFLQCP